MKFSHIEMQCSSRLKKERHESTAVLKRAIVLADFAEL